MFKKVIASKVMRRRVSWVIAAVLILPFVLFFHATGRGPEKGPNGSAGVIFGKPIPWETFQQQRRWLRRQLESRLGEFPDALEAMLTQSTWDRLMLLEEAKRRHLRVSDQDLAVFIRRIPVFQDQGRFVPERYYQLLRATGTNAQAFEGMLRNDLLLEQLVNGMKQSVTVTDDEVKAAYVAEHEQRRATLMVFETASFTQRMAAGLTEDDLRAFYQTHAEELRIPEQLVGASAGVTREELAARTQPSNESLQAFYQDHKLQFTREDGTLTPFEEVAVSVRHQVIDEQVRKQLNALAMDLEEDLDNALAFEEIVKTRALILHPFGPLDAQSAGRSARSGTGRAGDGPEPDVLEAIRSLPEGQLSGVIETDVGVFVARVTQRIPSRIPPFEEVRAEVKERAVQARARDAAKAAADATRARLSHQVASGVRVEEAVLTGDPLPVHAAQFTRTDPIDPIGAVAAVNEAAFALPLGALSEVIETPDSFVIIRPETRIPADEDAFTKEAASLRQTLLTRKQTDQFTQELQQLRQRAKLESFVE